MKKKILAGVLAVASAISVFAFSACAGNDGDNGDDTDTDTVETIVKDEETWNNAFKNVDYANFSMRVMLKPKELEVAHINNCKITENAVYYNIENQTEFYTLKQEDETYTTYMKGYDLYQDKSYSRLTFTMLNDTSDKYINGARTETILKVSYADYFELFTYDEENSAYTYNGVIETTASSYDGSETETIKCTNIVIKVLNNKIIYIKSDYTMEYFEEGDEATLEYYDIGSTEVKVPDDVIANAVRETINN